MPKISVETGLKNERFFISFLEKTDWIKSVNLEGNNSHLEIQDIFHLESERSGVSLNFRRIQELTERISTKLREETLQNSTFGIKNSTFSCYFYMVSEAFFSDQKEPTKLFYIWKISPLPSSLSREEWSRSRLFPAQNCCFRNYLVNLGTDSTFQNTLKKMDDLDTFCCFPKNNVSINVEFFMNFENRELVKNKEKLNNLDELFALAFVGETASEGVYALTNFSYPQEFLNFRVENQQFAASIQKQLDQLSYGSLENPNCKELFSVISLEDGIFERFLFNSFFTVFIEQQEHLKILGDPRSKIKLLLLEFLF